VDWEFVQHVFPVTLTGNMGLCKSYSAPEVIKDPKQLSIESDIWSMGLVLLFVFFEVDVL
jgi:serine/threonine protein kinase